MKAHNSAEHFRSMFTARLADLPVELTPHHIIEIAFAAHRMVENLEAIHRDLKEDASALVSASSLSYLHDNTFLKLVIVDSICHRFRFRLHWWKRNSPVISQNIHNHRFHFYSNVLLGGVRNTVWTKSRGGSPYTHYKYQPRLGTENYVLSEVGTSLLSIDSTTHQSAGSLYNLNAEVLHTSDPSHGEDVITLFVEDRIALREFADVFSNRYSGRHVTIPSPSLSPSEYSNHLSDLVSLLKNNEMRFH
jgi:hypothetical protein